MTDAAVRTLRGLEPFASLDPAAFPRSTPLDGILRNDCRLHRFLPGEVIVREGDYGHSAFLVLDGDVRVFVGSLPPERLGRPTAKPIGWATAIARMIRRSRHPETRDRSQVAAVDSGVTTTEDDSATRGPAGQGGHATERVATKTIGDVADKSDRPRIFLQDFDVILDGADSVGLGPGELFGEVAAMYRSPRTATVVASGPSTLLEIRWQGLRVLRRDRGFSDRLEAHYRANWLIPHLRETPLLRFLPETSLRRVAEATVLRSFGRMEWNADYRKTRRLPPAEQIASEPLVADEGREPTELVIVRSGFGRVCQAYGAGHRTVAYIGKGHLFGLEEIAHTVLRPEGTPSKPLQSSLRAVGLLDTLHIPVECVAEEILPHVRRSELPESVAAWMTAVPSRSIRPSRSTHPNGLTHPTESIQANGSIQPQGERRRTTRRDDSRADVGPDTRSSEGTRFERSDLLEFVVQHRLNNGQDAMLIDLDRCTRCDDCVRACATVHDGNPRFARQGPRHGRLQFVQACMHCTDPVCMIGCPTGAIARDPSTGVVEIHEPICVGCGVCASACPYDTIQMVEIVDRDGRVYSDETTGKPITKATKCDRCNASPSGPACVAACPHDAIVRLDLSESRPLDAWLERRS